MGAVEIGLLVLLAFVFVFGVGVVLLNRRRGTELPPAVKPVERGARDGGGATKSGSILEERTASDVATIDPDVIDPDVIDPVVIEPEVVEVEPEPVPGTLRERLAKARSTFAGAIAGVLGRSGITDESFEDLEEALLRADVGVGITDELLDGLRARVKAKEITEPAALLDALQEEMAGRLRGSDRTLNFEARGETNPTCGCSSASTAWARRPRSASWRTSRRSTGAACCWRRVTRSVPPPPSNSTPGPNAPEPSSCGEPKAATPVR